MNQGGFQSWNLTYSMYQWEIFQRKTGDRPEHSPQSHEAFRIVQQPICEPARYNTTMQG
jgi:hypothetical protein